MLTILVRDAAVPHRHEEVVTLPELRGLVTTEEKRMDLVIEEEDLDKTIYIDVTRTNTLAKSHQGALVTTYAVMVRQKAYNAKKVIKYDDYHAEAARRNAPPPPPL